MNTIVFTFGRMNPPTRAHQHLVARVLETAKSLSADHRIYLSQTQGSTSNPLDWSFKVRVCESAFPGVSISRDTSIKTPFQALSSFVGVYQRAVLVVGGDQFSEFESRMTPYAAQWGLDFAVINAGERIKESTGIAGISSTKLRQYAISGNRDRFFECLPDKLSASARQLIYETTRRNLKKYAK